MLAVLLMLAASAAEPTEGPDKVVAAFVASWLGPLRQELTGDKRVRAAVWDSPLEQPPTSAERGSCRAAASRPADTLSAYERKTLVLQGSLEALAVDGTCWTLTWSNPFTSLQAITDEAGAPLMVWVIPEG